jgi:hypothetical protein
MYLAPKYKYTLLLLYYKTSVTQINQVNINIEIDSWLCVVYFYSIFQFVFLKENAIYMRCHHDIIVRSLG